MVLNKTALMFGGGALLALAFVASRSSASGTVTGTTSGARVPPPEPQGYVWGYWTADDFRTLASIARTLKMKPADLLMVLASESGLDPRATNPANSSNPIAAGLNQLTSAANASVGITEAERLMIPKLPVSMQLPLVYRYFASLPYTKAGNTYGSAGVVYAANFAPARIGSGTDDQVLYSQDEGDPYELNKSLDRDGKGTITIGDMNRQLAAVAGRSLYKTARANLAAYAGV
jgi:hypothetical protein